MPTIVSNINKAYNNPLLTEEVVATYADAGVTIRPRPAPVYGELEVTHTSVTQGGLDTIIAAHNDGVLSTNQQIEQAAIIAIEQGKDYLRKQMLQASPNITTIYNNLKSQVESNAYLARMVDNQIAINSNAFVWTLNLVTPTAIDRQRYIRCVEDVIALLT